MVGLPEHGSIQSNFMSIPTPVDIMPAKLMTVYFIQ